MITAQEDMTAPSTVASIRAPIRLILGTMQMHRTSAALARATENLHIINKITLHGDVKE